MKFPRQLRPFRGSFDFAPYAGVFFIFLLFVMLQSSVIYQPGVTVDLPKAEGLPGIKGPVLVAVVDASGQIYYDNQIIGEKALQTALRAELLRLGQPATLVIQADRNVKYEQLLNLSTLAREAGIQQALLAARPAPGARPVTLGTNSSKTKLP
jgi:biopolymer transport protein ExbD